MKVLIVNITRPNIDTRSIKLKRILEKQGHEVKFYWALNAPRIKIIGKEISIVGLFIVFIKNLVTAIRGDYDIAHLIDGWDVALLPFLLSSRPNVFDVRSLWPLMIRGARQDKKLRAKAFFRELITRFLIARSDSVISVDSRITQIIRRYGAKDVTYLRNLPDKDMFDCVPFDRDPEYIDFAYFGSFAVQRRTKELLQAWHKFVEDKQGRCRLFLIGWDCTDGDYLKYQINPYVDNKTVFYVGRFHFNDVARYYRKMDFTVIPNKGDHWQLKVGESMAAGVPVILREGPLHRVLVGDLGAVYFESDNREDDAEAILPALEYAFINHERLVVEARSRKPKYMEDDVKRVIQVYEVLIK